MFTELQEKFIIELNKISANAQQRIEICFAIEKAVLELSKERIEGQRNEARIAVYL